MVVLANELRLDVRLRCARLLSHRISSEHKAKEQAQVVQSNARVKLVDYDSYFHGIYRRKSQFGQIPALALMPEVMVVVVPEI